MEALSVLSAQPAVECPLHWQVPPISQLATEILMLIFCLALPDHLVTLPSDTDAPVSVSRVSRHWRMTSIATAGLWSTMTIDLSRPPKYDEKFWMTRSAGGISMMASIRVLGIAIRHLERFRSTIIPHIHRICCLDLRGTPQQLRALFGLDATMLQSLKFRYDTTYSHQHRFQPPPLCALNLASLDITGGGILGLSDFPVHWEHLTQLRTTGVFCDPLDALRVLP
ncbi:hypothetical protein B0H14DRAFT_672034 [Mycena olivaceomarginata]|nr:hypothetical protein B0H14DRAFT_672034 [Mycena olivaceomarginata]